VPGRTDSSRPAVPVAGPLSLALGLAAVTGCLDAVSLARITRTFVGFQTGNTVLAGLGVGQGDWAQAVPPAAAVLAYLAGSVLAHRLMVVGPTAPRAVVRRLLALAVALLAVNAAVVVVGAGGDGDPPVGLVRYVSIVVSAVAMACQTPTVRVVEGVSVSSTFSTGMLTRLGQAFAAPRSRTAERVVTRVLGGVILAFLGGAIVGGVALELVGNAAAVVPPVALALVTVASGRAGRRSG
jgi:uncharacterized membrane protein YoaK (UPF0700 family)